MAYSRPEGALSAILVSPSGRAWIDAGRLCVDFAMTGPWPGAGPRGERWEGLTESADLADWFRACRLGLGHLDVTSDDLTGALELRGAVWVITRAAVVDGPHQPNAVAVLNAYAADDPLVPQLGRGGHRWLRPTAAAALSTIARDAVGLHGDRVQLERLRECASDDCPRAFYDTSRAGTRRWCDPVRCGDRQRARAYRRSRAARATQSTTDRRIAPR